MHGGLKIWDNDASKDIHWRKFGILIQWWSQMFREVNGANGVDSFVDMEPLKC